MTAAHAKHVRRNLGGGVDMQVYEGAGTSGRVIATVDGSQVREGMGARGRVMATIDGSQAREGIGSFGRVIATINGNQVHEGATGFGRVIACGDPDISAVALGAALACFLLA